MLSSLATDKRILVCCGAGGVGKTTTAAAIALAAAQEGRRVAVLTVDPARRLANALGLEDLPSEPAQVTLEPPARGTLHALMLDPKATFDALVRKLNPDPAVAQRIFDNRLYRQLSSLLAGIQEYTAQEKLYELAQDERFDLVVVDTPPTRNALDFLEASGKLTRFFDERVLRFFAPRKPRRFGLLHRTGQLVGTVLDRVFGAGFAEELSAFFGTIGGMTSTFRAHAQEIRALLASPAASFLLVTAPEAAAIEDALFFRARLSELGLPFGGYVVNRLHPQRPLASASERRETQEAFASALSTEEAARLAEKVESSYEQERARGELDREVLELLQRQADARIVGVPRLETDIASLPALLELSRRAFTPTS